jgi:hypothetical protein
MSNVYAHIQTFHVQLSIFALLILLQGSASVVGLFIQSSKAILSCSMTEISLQHVVKAPHLKHVWIPECKTIGGYVFVRLCKWDRGWVRFLNDQALNFADRTTFANSSFLDSLRRLRNNVYDAALQSMRAMEADADNNDHSEQPRKRRAVKSRKARTSDEAVLPPFLEVEMPALHGEHTFGAGPHRARVILEGLRTQTLWIELTGFNLDYIKYGVLHSQLGRCRRKRSEEELIGRDVAEVDQQAETSDDEQLGR